MKLISLFCLLFVFATESTHAFKCYQCDSAIAPNCAALLDGSIQPQICQIGFGGFKVSEQITNFAQNFNLKQLTGGYEVQGCLKIVTFENNILRVRRQCAFGLQNANQCHAQDLQQKLLGRQENLVSCNYCDRETCNSAITSKGALMPIILFIAAIVLLI